MSSATPSDTSSYEPVSQILERMKDYYIRLRDQLIEAHPVDEATDLIRQSIRKSVQQRIRAFEDYVRTGDDSVLETWIQYVSSEEIKQRLEMTDLTGTLTKEELIERKSRFDQAVAEFFHHLARETSAARVEEVFEQLAEQTEQESAQQSYRAIDSDLA